MALLTMPTSTNADVLLRESVNLATDATSLLVSCREAFRPEHAYTLAMECARIAVRIRKARDEALPWEGTRYFREARLAAVRAMMALDRTGVCAPLLREVDPEVEGILRRLSDLALALGALARESDGNEAA